MSATVSKVFTSEKNNRKIDTQDKEVKVMFNNEIKERFLDEMVKEGHINEATKKSYRNLFFRTKDLIEEKLGKDLFELSLVETEKLFVAFKANNRNTIESYARIISSYLNWATKEKFTKMNVTTGLKPDDFIKYLKNEEEYFSYDRLMYYEEACKNAQDAVILRLIFNGIIGKNLSEIRNLKFKEHVDKKRNMIYRINSLVEDKKTGLPIDTLEGWEDDIDDYTIDLIEDAYNEKIYFKKNGNMEKSTGNSRGIVRDYTDLLDGDYVIRASNTTKDAALTESNQPVNRHVVYRRIKMLAEYLNLVDILDAKYIQRSGMIYYASKLIVDEELSVNSLKKVAKRFGMQSHHNLKGFLTVENIRKIYPKKDD